MPDAEHDLPEQVLAAARDDIAAHRPDRTPPFAALQARKRRRDARRGGAALAATALAVAGVALVPSALSGGTSTDPSQVAAGPGAGEVFRYHVGTDGPDARSATSGDALDRCLALPGVSDGVVLQSLPAQYTGKVTGQDQADAFVACVEDVPGRTVTLGQEVVSRPPGLQPEQRLSVTFERGIVFDQGFNGRQVDACLRLPGTSVVQVDYSMPPAYSVSVTGAAQLKAVQTCLDEIDGTVVKVATQTEPDEESAVAWTGAQVCVVGQDDECRRLGADQARSLYQRLEAAPKEPAGQAHCQALSTVYGVLFEHPSVKPVPFEVPYLCGPMTVGNERRVLDQAGRDAVRLAFETGNPDTPTAWTTGDGLTAEQRAFVESCVGSETPLPAADYEGLDEKAATAAYGPSTRVVGRDGQCLGRTRDLREDRVDLIVEDGKVIWAGRS